MTRIFAYFYSTFEWGEIDTNRRLFAVGSTDGALSAQILFFISPFRKKKVYVQMFVFLKVSTVGS